MVKARLQDTLKDKLLNNKHRCSNQEFVSMLS